MSDTSKAAALLGRLGGRNGTGASKRRSSDHYRKAALLRWKKWRAEKKKLVGKRLSA